MNGPDQTVKPRKRPNPPILDHSIRSSCLSRSAASPRQLGAPRWQTLCCYSNRTSAEAPAPLSHLACDWAAACVAKRCRPDDNRPGQKHSLLLRLTNKASMGSNL